MQWLCHKPYFIDKSVMYDKVSLMAAKFSEWQNRQCTKDVNLFVDKHFFLYVEHIELEKHLEEFIHVFLASVDKMSSNISRRVNPTVSLCVSLVCPSLSYPSFFINILSNLLGRYQHQWSLHLHGQHLEYMESSLNSIRIKFSVL